jgi:hypothetical protein
MTSTTTATRSCALQRGHTPNSDLVHEQRRACWRRLGSDSSRGLEPGAIEHKFYARGVGFIQSVALRGGRERLELVTILQTQ